MMKILVPVKRVPDPYGAVVLNASGEIDIPDGKWVINPFDEIALEQAVRMRESGLECEITAACVGGPECEATLRNALAAGADRAVLIEAEDDPEPRAVAHCLHAIALRDQAGLVLMGKQAIDDDNGQVGPRLAARWNVPQATFASSVELSEDLRKARVTREVDAGQETLSITLPAVVTVDLRLNEPRYVALPAILKARSKPLERVSAATLGPPPEGGMSVVNRQAPPARKPGRLVASVAELVSVLKNEAGVL